jgi:hypothetical protein
MQRIHFLPALAVILKAHPMRQREEIGEAFPERRVAGDLAADVADDPAQPGLEEFELAPGALEL